MPYYPEIDNERNQFIIEKSLHYQLNVLQRKFYTYKSFMNILFYPARARIYFVE